MISVLVGISTELFGEQHSPLAEKKIIQAGIRFKPSKFLALAHLSTFLICLVSACLPIFYLFVFQNFTPLLVLPTLSLLIIFLLESFSNYSFSPILLFLDSISAFKKSQVEQELPYSIIFLNQLLSIKIPFETALEKLKAIPQFSPIFDAMTENSTESESLEEFSIFLDQCRVSGVTQQVLEDLDLLASTYREAALSRFRATGELAGQLFTYILALYTVSILILILASFGINYVPGIEFLILDIINPLLFAAGAIYLFGRLR